MLYNKVEFNNLIVDCLCWVKSHHAQVMKNRSNIPNKIQMGKENVRYFFPTGEEGILSLRRPLPGEVAGSNKIRLATAANLRCIYREKYY